MQALWDRIEAWLMMNAPEEMFSLQPGATDQDIREAETAMGIELPDDLLPFMCVESSCYFQ